jgi:hypothetical protein
LSAATWISESRGKTTAYFKPASKINGNIDTLVILKDGNIYDVIQGDYVIRNVDGEFDHMSGSQFEASFDFVTVDESENFGTLGSIGYQPTGKPGKSLLGGAALQIPT